MEQAKLMSEGIEKKWNKYEAALLLDMFLKIKSSIISRKEGVAQLSHRFRAAAISRGVAIDDKYRNENGISLQMSSMEYSYTQGRSGLNKVNQAFERACYWHSEFPSYFKEILEEAERQYPNHNMPSMKPETLTGMTTSNTRTETIHKIVVPITKELKSGKCTIPDYAISWILEATGGALKAGCYRKIAIWYEHCQYSSALTCERKLNGVEYSIRFYIELQKKLKFEKNINNIVITHQTNSPYLGLTMGTGKAVDGPIVTSTDQSDIDRPKVRAIVESIMRDYAVTPEVRKLLETLCVQLSDNNTSALAAKRRGRPRKDTYAKGTEQKGSTHIKAKEKPASIVDDIPQQTEYRKEIKDSPVSYFDELLELFDK